MTAAKKPAAKTKKRVRGGPRTNLRAGQVPRPERVELIRELLIGGTPEYEIRRMFTVDGVAMPAASPYTGLTIKIGERTLQRDFEEIGREFRKLYEDPEVAARFGAGSVQRMLRYQGDAAKAGQWGAVIRFEQVLLKLVGLLPRPVVAAAPAVVEATRTEAERLAELQAVSDDELLQRAASSRQRVEQLRLLVGGKTT